MAATKKTPEPPPPPQPTAPPEATKGPRATKHSRDLVPGAAKKVKKPAKKRPGTS